MVNDVPIWTEVSGTWVDTGLGLRQTDVSQLTRCYWQSGLSDFVAQFAFTLEKEGESGGEAKFVYSGADLTEEYRIDFVYRWGACRVTAGRWAGMGVLELVPGRQHRTRIRVRANIVRVDVDDMPVVPGFNFGKHSDGKIGFATWCGGVLFEDIKVQRYEQRRCFVIMPFDEKRNLLYEDVLRPALESHPEYVFDFTRADESLTVGKITEEIDELIDCADVLIADITVQNPNVYYELGSGHARSKKALLLAEAIPGLMIPFDLKDFRHHRYEFTRSGLDDLRAKVQGILSNILNPTQST